MATGSRQAMKTAARQKRILRAVLAYWVVAWTSIEVCSVLEDALALPEWLDQFAVMLCLVGLPFVVASACLFGWSPTSVTNRSDGNRDWAKNDREALARSIADEVYARLLVDMQDAGDTPDCYGGVRKHQ